MTQENTHTPVSPSVHVTEFHTTYGQVIRVRPDITVPELFMRLDLIVEEVTELIGAVLGKAAGDCLAEAWEKAKTLDDGTRDIIETADALADLIYVIYGMGLTVGIDLDDVLLEVQGSNMSKLGEDGKPIYREDGKVLKGPGFYQPDIAKVLRRQGWEGETSAE
jgi:predicted HAD superfamily Cof-like phosphohydrolase